MKDSFIDQTAKDYDLPYDVVEEVYNEKEYLSDLYDELERLTVDRCNDME